MRSPSTLYPPRALAQRWSRKDWQRHRRMLEERRDTVIAVRANQKTSPSGFVEAITDEQLLSDAINHAAAMAGTHPKIGRA